CPRCARRRHRSPGATPWTTGWSRWAGSCTTRSACGSGRNDDECRDEMNAEMTGPGLSRRAALGLLGGAGVAGVALAAGCGSSGGSASGGPVTLSFAWWGDASRAKATQAAVDLFQRKHPTIKVTTQYAPFGDYFTKLATQVAGGNAPDLFQ